jgi:hypothetical protein
MADCCGGSQPRTELLRSFSDRCVPALVLERVLAGKVGSQFAQPDGLRLADQRGVRIQQNERVSHSYALEDE